MAFLLFVDESGQDRGDSPYEVLAGIAIEDQDLWNLVLALRDAEGGKALWGAIHRRSKRAKG
jgi:hypothetical protein